MRASAGPGQAIRHWLLSSTREERFDVPPQPMQGEMDPFFFLSMHRNFIPHEYPCRTAFAERHRGRRPEPAARFKPKRFYVPFDDDRVDLSGFWFRPGRVETWAATILRSSVADEARFRLTTCGGALVEANGVEAAWLAGYQRNLEESVEFAVSLKEGDNEVRVWFGDLCERDARYFFKLELIDGPILEVAPPLPVSAERAAAVERMLTGMRFERSFYESGEIALRFPEAATADLGVLVKIFGDAISSEGQTRRRALRAGEDRLVIGFAETLPADFRHVRIRLEDGAFCASRMIGVEVCPAIKSAPSDRFDRAEEALRHVARAAEPDTVKAFARLALDGGGAETDAIIDGCLPAIFDCHDCADFLLVPLLQARMLYPERIGPQTRARVDDAILAFRYWMDEPGDDVMWYFSENHALLFHTSAYLAGALFPKATFERSGRTGREQRAIGRARLLGWLDHFERWEMAEWNSAPYFPIDFKGLAALFSCAPDDDIRRRAGAAIERLMEIVARSSHQGVLTASQGRSYEHTLRPGRTLELSSIGRLFWGRGWMGRRFHALPQLAVCVRDHGLTIDPGLKDVAFWRGEPVEWRFRQGENGIAALYHYKTPDYAMGSLAAYRWGAWGYQETVLHLRLGERPEAQIWINHPGETVQSGFGRPSYWGGCGTLPRAHQYRALAMLDFDAHPEQPDFTHAWLPEGAMDEVLHERGWVLIRAGRALALLKGSGAFERVLDGPSAGCEIRLPGRKGRWIVRLSDLDHEEDLAAFGRRMRELRVEERSGERFVLHDPDYGAVVCLNDGVIEAEGRRVDPAAWTIKGERVGFVSSLSNALARSASGGFRWS